MYVVASLLGGLGLGLWRDLAGPNLGRACGDSRALESGGRGAPRPGAIAFLMSAQYSRAPRGWDGEVRSSGRQRQAPKRFRKGDDRFSSSSSDDDLTAPAPAPPVVAPAATSPTPATEAGEIARLTQRLSAPAPDDGSASLRNFAPDAATDCLVDFFRSGFEAAKRARLRELCTSGMAATTPNEVRMSRKSVFIGPQCHGKKWQVQIQGLNGARVQIGQFHGEEEAALAYNKAILDRGLQAHGRKINPVDADGRPLPKAPKSSKYYGVYRQHPTQHEGAKVANFKGSYLGRFPLVLADFWTSDHLSERFRSMDVGF